MRRLTASAVAMTMTSGACSERSWRAVNCEAPAITITVIPMVSASPQPASAATTPKSSPNGTMTMRNGSASRKPRQNAARSPVPPADPPSTFASPLPPALPHHDRPVVSTLRPRAGGRR